MADGKDINKTMDRDDLESTGSHRIVEELNGLIKELEARGLKISSWYGKFDLSGHPGSREWMNRGYGYRALDGLVNDRNFPWFLYWEIVWVVLNGGFRPGQKVLDLGGSSSLFSYYLAFKGLDVTTIDLQKELVDNANHVATQMGWGLKNYVMDMRELRSETKYDHITSICVYEHVPMYDRVAVNRQIKECLVDGGRFSVTFDYRNPSRRARIGSPQDVYTQFVEPSGLKVRGKKRFFDNGKSYLLHPFYHRGISWVYKVGCVVRGDFPPRELFSRKDGNDYTFGALFLENTEGPLWEIPESAKRSGVFGVTGLAWLLSGVYRVSFVRRMYWNWRARKIHQRWGRITKDYEVLREIILSISADRILEIGCGGGRLFDLYLEMGVRQVIAQDISRRALALARKKGNQPNITLIQSPIEALDFPESSVDLVISNRVLQHIPPNEIESTIKKICELGRFVYVNEVSLHDKMASGPHMFRHDYERLFGSQGFRVVRRGAEDEGWGLFAKEPLVFLAGNSGR